jgi:hypothetical protein
MSRARMPFIFLAAALVAGPASLSHSAEMPSVVGREVVALFALGYSGRDIPLETLGAVDRAIRKVFLDFGRYTVVGMEQRLSSIGVAELVAAVGKAGNAGFVAPDEYRFGEALLTPAEFDGLLGASIIAIPVVVELDSFYAEAEGAWETDIKTSFTFISPGSGGAVLGAAEVFSSGIDESDQERSLSDAVENIPMRLQYELRKIGVFRTGARVLAVSGRDIELGLGRKAGVRKGDEYAVVAEGPAEGIGGSGELGLVTIKKTAQDSSAGRILYSRVELSVNARLEEIPRLGIDVEPYLHYVVGRKLDLVPNPRLSRGRNVIAGLRVPVSRGFYGLRPYGAIQVPTDGVRGFGSAFLFPVDLILGAEYRPSSGRLSLTPYGGLGVGCVFASETIHGESADGSNSPLPHFGGHAYLDLAYLASRNVRLFIELGGEYWISAVTDLYTDYGGVGFGAGVSIKL